MPVVTVRGHLGSGAPEIGKLIASKLNIDYVDREIIADVAKHLHWGKEGVEEKDMPPGTLGGRILEALSHAYPAGMYGGAYVPAWEMPLDDLTYLEGLKSVILELAGSKSIVIRGRGSQFILKDFPDAFHVLLVAPSNIRIGRIMKIMGKDEEEAKKEIERFDSSQREFTKRYFHGDLHDPLHYDMVVNTNNIIYETAASVIVSVIEKEEKQ